jgi:Zn-dependent peptidase ImmA (M78 family)
MFRHYHMTILEEFLEDVYRRAGITTPQQLTVAEISQRLNVWVHYRPVGSRALEAVSGMYSMFLDERISPDQQRLDFLHELCHLLRHAGNQIVLPESFTRMQENEAEHFVLYAAMPFSMIRRLEVPDGRGPAIAVITESFNVPAYLAEQRLDQLQRRTLQGMWNAVVRDHGQVQRQPSWSTETMRILKQLDRQLIAKGMPPHADHSLV